MADKKASFEESMKKLEEIVADLEKGEFPLEESLAKFEEGLAVGKKCKKLLDNAEAKVKKITKAGLNGAKEEDVTGEF